MKYRFYHFFVAVAGFILAVGCAPVQGNLMLAAHKGRTETVKAFLAAGADVNAKTKDGLTVLMCAAQEGHTETVKALLAAGADVGGKYGITPLMIAEREGYTEIVQLLKEAGAQD